MAATLDERVIALERRVSEIEGQLGFLLPTLKQVHLDLIGFKEQTEANFARLNSKFGALAGEVGSLGGRVDGLDRKVNAIDKKLGALDTKFDALPRVLAEMLDERQKRKS